jgi:hypothetical protein
MGSNHELDRFFEVSQLIDSTKSLKSSKAGFWYKIGTNIFRDPASQELTPTGSLMVAACIALSSWQSEPKTSAAACAVQLNPDASAVTSDDRLAEGQPKTRPPWTASVQAYKWQEHARVMLGDYFSRSVPSTSVHRFSKSLSR